MTPRKFSPEDAPKGCVAAPEGETCFDQDGQRCCFLDEPECPTLRGHLACQAISRFDGISAVFHQISATPPEGSLPPPPEAHFE